MSVSKVAFFMDRRTSSQSWPLGTRSYHLAQRALLAPFDRLYQRPFELTH